MADARIGSRTRVGRERHERPDEVDSNLCGCGIPSEDRRSGRLGAAGFDLCCFGPVKDPMLPARADRSEAASRNRQEKSAPRARNATRRGWEDAWHARSGPGPTTTRGQPQAGGPTTEAGHRVSLGRRCLAEFMGTFALVGVGSGIDLAASIPGASNEAVRAVAPGLLVGAFIYALGDISGAHFNPVVSAAFVIKRLFPPRWLPAYWIAQLGGAVAAAVFFRALLGDIGGLGVTRHMVGAAPAVAIEGLATFFLVTVILGTADRYRVVGTDAALAVGATIALCGLWAGPLTGASMNPARSLGPAIVSGSIVDAWIYVAGPALGALVALVVARVLHGPFTPDPDKLRAAEGT